MGKDTKSIQRGETFSRINYLYQAAHAALVATPHNLQLTRTYIQMLKAIAEKSVLRLDPSMKRTLCKRCYMLLVPGISSSMSIRSKRQKHMIVRCLECGTVKRFNINTEYKLWSQQPEAWLNTPPRHTMNTDGKINEEVDIAQTAATMDGLAMTSSGSVGCVVDQAEDTTEKTTKLSKKTAKISAETKTKPRGSRVVSEGLSKMLSKEPQRSMNKNSGQIDQTMVKKDILKALVTKPAMKMPSVPS